MKKFDTHDKERLRMLCANLLLYTYPPGGGYARPHAIRFKRNGEVWGYLAAHSGWRCLAGYRAEGPASTDRWEF